MEKTESPSVQAFDGIELGTVLALPEQKLICPSLNCIINILLIHNLFRKLMCSGPLL